jgi:membrane-bound lytic murein transglycosylase B
VGSAYASVSRVRAYLATAVLLSGASIIAPPLLADSRVAAISNEEPRNEPQGPLDALWPATHAKGISRAVFDRYTADFVLDPEVVRLATSQPEHVKPPGAYVSDLVTPERVEIGRTLAAKHARTLAAIEAAYGVDRHILLAIWGVESAYGTTMGSRSVVRSLATLAVADQRRAPFWRSELIAALRILQDGQTAPETFVGSWAGATGHTQFIPTAYAAHAVDFDKDGRRDIWGTVADALASTANYLRTSGWAAGMPWGLEVTLPPGFDYSWSAPGRPQALSQWLAAGVRIPAGPANLQLGLPLQLVLPAGAQGPAFLVTKNFRAILRYNNATAYALAVGHLANRIAGGAPLTAAWPAGDKPLGRGEREELQRLLAERGHDTGGLDGIMGDQTRTAIRATQRSLKLAEDGHPSLDLLQRLRADPVP